MKPVILQKEKTRYTFRQSKTNTGNPLYCIESEVLLTTGSCVSYRYVTKETGNEFYKNMVSKGFHRFRNVHEVSWYATTENNTPYDEEWKIDGILLIPVRSRVLYK